MKYIRLLILILAVFLVSCASEKTPEKPVSETHSKTCVMDCGFDTFFSLNDIPMEQENFSTTFSELLDEYKHYNDLFDIYNDYEGLNNLKTINDMAGIQPVEVEDAIIELLLEAREFYELSGGAFDITMGNLLKVWHEYRTEGMALNEQGKPGRLPSAEELQKAYEHHGWEYVEINESAHTVFITDPQVSLDVGGIAKGFAAEKIAQRLEAMGVHGGIVNAGGNNRMLGPKKDGSDWRVGIIDPYGKNNNVVVRIYGAVSSVTSGDYMRYYMGPDNIQLHHIIDPDTLHPADLYHSVTIFTRDSGSADCLSTTLFTLSCEEGMTLIEQYRQAHPDDILEVVWLMDKKELPEDVNYLETDDFYVLYTEGLKEKISG